MKHLKMILLCLLAAVSTGLWAQKQEFTLEDAILTPRKFIPEAYLNVQWSPSGARWAHYDAVKGMQAPNASGCVSGSSW
mgnify:CR=1 FL=1